MNLCPYDPPRAKKLKVDYKAKCATVTLRLLGESIGKVLQDTGMGKNFLGQIPEAQEIKA